jgi:hypothetical protein
MMAAPLLAKLLFSTPTAGWLAARLRGEGHAANCAYGPIRHRIEIA